MKTLHSSTYKTIKKTVVPAVLASLLLMLNASAQSDDLPQTNASDQEMIENHALRLQSNSIDTIGLYDDLIQAKMRLEQKQTGELLAKTYRHLAEYHNKKISVDSVEYYYNKAADLYKELGLNVLQADMYLLLEDAYKQRAQYAKAMEVDFKAIEIYEAIANRSGVARVYTRLCDILYYQQDYVEGAEYCQKAIDIQKNLNEPDELAKSYRYKADNLLIIGDYAEALNNINQAITVLKNANRSENELAPNYNTRGNIYKYQERYDEAIAEYKKCYAIAKSSNETRGIIPALGNIGHVYRIQGKYEEALPYTLEAIQLMKESGKLTNLAENYMHAAGSYKALGNYEKALEYQELYHEEKLRTLNLIVDQLESELQIKYETVKKDERIGMQEAELQKQKRIQLLYFGIGFLLLVIVAGMYFTIKNNKKKRLELLKLNEEIKTNQVQLERSNKKLQDSLNELKATQAQLIQSEKMASLGELTAGIAHEIQNPLNFVNNFSEVSYELIDEMKEEIDNNDLDEVKAIAEDIKMNLQKINHHGKRADSIVKGMLQHSRSNSGEKEKVDLNKLTDEYVRLAYHGLRAKNKDFNAQIETHFDENIPQLKLVPQDIGRVILNLITNAFHAVDEKKKENQVTDYIPTVSISTLNKKDEILIKVTDNGKGIPKAVVKKIFEPFFTTKPTGQGTGLGLSMSYEIVKAHGGDIEVDTHVGESTTFTIILPVKTN